MLIFGKTNDDKGTQLETLTRDLLCALGYVNVVTNLVSSGGEEIDVSADYIVPGLDSQNTRRLICECKAYKNTINVNHWLKFLGKVFSEEARQNEEVFACFIALSGVNGNVAGHYDELRRHRSGISLVTGDSLLNVVARAYSLCNLETIAAKLRQFTARQFRTTEAGYYDKRVYWIIIFEDDSYTVLDSKGDPFEGERLSILSAGIEEALAVRSYINLREEAEAIRRSILAQKILLSYLMVDDGTTSIKRVQEDNKEFTEQELTSALNTLIQQDWVTKDSESIAFSFQFVEPSHLAARMVDIYRFLLFGDFPTKALGCPFYDAQINEDFVSEIQRIQGNLPLPPEDIKIAIQLLRWSPEALFWALTPDPMITIHRSQQGFLNKPIIDTHDRNYFFRMLCRGLMHDFGPPPIAKYFFEDRKIRSIETTQTVIIECESKGSLKGEIHEKQHVVQMANEYGGGYVGVLALDDAPRPWEWYSQSPEQKVQGEDSPSNASESNTQQDA